MLKKILKFKIKKTTSSESSDFSRFFREATDKERESVFLKAAKAANEDQRKLMNLASSR